MKKIDFKNVFNAKALRKAAIWTGAIVGGMAVAYVTGGLAFSGSMALLTTVGLSKATSAVAGGAVSLVASVGLGVGTMYAVSKLDRNEKAEAKPASKTQTMA